MKFDMPIVETSLGYLLVPAFSIWVITWKPNPSRLTLAFRVLLNWGVVARLLLSDMAQVFGGWRWYFNVLGDTGVICVGIYLTMRAFHLHRAYFSPSNTIDSISPGRPS